MLGLEPRTCFEATVLPTEPWVGITAAFQNTLQDAFILFLEFNLMFQNQNRRSCMVKFQSAW